MNCEKGTCPPRKSFKKNWQWDCSVMVGFYFHVLCSSSYGAEFPSEFRASPVCIWKSRFLLTSTAWEKRSSSLRGGEGCWDKIAQGESVNECCLSGKQFGRMGSEPLTAVHAWLCHAASRHMASEGPAGSSASSTMWWLHYSRKIRSVISIQQRRKQGVERMVRALRSYVAPHHKLDFWEVIVGCPNSKQQQQRAEWCRRTIPADGRKPTGTRTGRGRATCSLCSKDTPRPSLSLHVPSSWDGCAFISALTNHKETKFSTFS